MSIPKPGNMKIITTVIFIVFSALAYGQLPVQNFTLNNVDGGPVSLDSYTSVAGIAVIFTGNECAFDNYYTDRIKLFIEMFSGKIQFLLINSYVEPGESADKMAAKYKRWGFTVPYLIDKDQTAMNILGAKKSPEVFLLKNTGGKFMIVYQGALDDNPQMASDVKQTFLKTSIDKLLAGQKIDVPVMRAVGCSIRKK